MSGLLIFLGLAGYAVFFLWRVRVENGRIRRGLARVCACCGHRVAEHPRDIYGSCESWPWIYVGVDPGPPFENGWSNAWVDPDGILHIEGGAK